jgi:type III secretion protein V
MPAPADDLRAWLTRHANLTLAFFVVLSVGMMIVPLPTFFLDLVIALNIAASVTLLLLAIYVGEPLRIATFPSLLLLTTLFRLAIEVSATRLILLNANAGKIIAAFGGFVVAGNLIAGVVVFVILTTIQYVVIAKGAARVAEVGARFTLDAMPGKQMAIDAELRAGHIDANEAGRRRAALARESQFFGAMDGAMKFVRGDAVAGLVILLVNIVGGLGIGVLQRGLEVGTALRTYTLLTVGEGLVAQIPALVVSTAAGMLVTRVSSERAGLDLGSDIGRQILAQPRALAVTAALLLILAAVPGLPALPFLVLGAAGGLLAFRLLRGRTAATSERLDPAAAPAPLVEPIAIALGAALGDRLLPARGPSPLQTEWLPAVRADFFAESGIEVPEVALRVDPALAPQEFAIFLDEIPTAGGTLADEVAEAGIAARLRAVLRRHGHRFVGVEQTQVLLDRLASTHPALVRAVVPTLISPVLLAEVLHGLARESISLRHLADILTAIARRGAEPGDALTLVESARAALQRQLTHRHQAADGSVGVFFVDALIEETLRESIRDTDTGRHLTLEPDLARDIVRAVGRAVQGSAGPVLLTSADIRRHLRALVEHEQPDVAVLAYHELLPEAKLTTLGHVSIGQ